MFKKLIKIVTVIALLLIVIIGCWAGYMKFEEIQRDRAQLTFLSDVEWEWYDKYERIQFSQIPILHKTVLRKVNLHKQYAIYATKNPDYTLNARVVFAVKCKPNTSIVTSQTFSDGVPKELKCSSDGESLSYSVRWASKNTDIVWSDNLDGFEVYENFGNWDFSVLDQEITLLKAK